MSQDHGTHVSFQVLAVVGPTASGKSALADVVANYAESVVISADAMQVYRHMDIGTAKTPVSERKAPLLCVDLVDPTETYSVAQYASVAHGEIDRAVASGKVPVICGGTGLYVRAAAENMDYAAGEQTENEVRSKYERLLDTIGAEALHHLLSERDKRSASLIHPNNSRRVIRALEMLDRGESYAEKHEHLHTHRDRYQTLYIGLNMDRPLLYERINRRVDKMFEDGLLEEVIRLERMGFASSLTSIQAIGYKELLECIPHTAFSETRGFSEPEACAYITSRHGDDITEAKELIKLRSRRYSKRQISWFKSDDRIHWIDSSHLDVDSTARELLKRIHAD